MKTIAIIAGHGGTPYDPGIRAYGREEAALTRELAALVQAELDKIFDIHSMLYIDNIAYEILDSGDSISLDDVDYVLEIHFNQAACDDTDVQSGAEIYVHPAETDISIATAILRKLCAWVSKIAA